MDEVLTVRKQAVLTRRMTCRDALSPVFRQKRIALIVFGGVFAGAILGAFLVPRKYEAEMKVLVNRDRIDAVVTPDANAPVPAAPDPVVTEEDLNSEVELIRSKDLLEQVVIQDDLERNSPSRLQTFDYVESALGIAPRPDENTRRARAVEALNEALTVEPLKKTDLIRVAYNSRSPELSARVLQTLAALYQEKHAAVHRPAGTYGFFDEQTTHYEIALRDAEAQLANFDASQGVTDPVLERQLVLEHLSGAESDWQSDLANERAAQSRIAELSAYAAAHPDRETTQVKNADNGELLAQLQSTLLSLRLKQMDAQTKYADNYPPVTEIASQIAATEKAIANAQGSPVKETTTDRVPAQDWVATELAKANADRAQSASQAGTTAQTIAEYRKTALDIDRKQMKRDDLLRDVKTAENDYLLYQNKREAARISDALDNRRIVNVSIAEAATVPALPTLHLGWLLIGGFFAAGAMGVGSAYAADRLSPVFRGPDELGEYLELRVLASIPAIGIGDSTAIGGDLAG